MKKFKEQEFVDTSEFKQAVEDTVRQFLSNPELSPPIQFHRHDGFDALPVQLKHLEGLFRTVTAVPDFTPRKAIDQILIYENAGSYALYLYDAANAAWVSVALST